MRSFCKEGNEKGRRALLRCALASFSLIFCLLFAACCTRTIVAERADSTHIERQQLSKVSQTRSEIVERDTIHIYTKGDTIYRDRIAWRERHTIQHDTLHIRDSVIHVVYKELTQQPPKRKPSWRKRTGWYLLVVSLSLSALGAVYWLVRRLGLPFFRRSRGA